MKKVVTPLVAFVLFGCGQQQSFDIAVPDTLDPKAKQVLQEAWPKVKKACVGLDRHAKALQFEGIQNNYSIAVVFRVPEQSSSIPDRFMAAGHTCYLEVSQDGKQLTVAKEGCKAVCLDRQIQQDDPTGQGNLELPL